MSALMASAGISPGPAAFPLLSVMMAFLISAFVGLSQLMGSSVSAGGMSGGVSGEGRFPELLCPSLQLFLGCRRLVSIFILHWLVCLLEFARQLLDYQVQVFEVPLSGCFLCLTGLVFDVIPFILPNAPLHFSVRCYILCYILSAPLPWLLLFGLCSGQFSSFSSSFWVVSAEIYSLC